MDEGDGGEGQAGEQEENPRGMSMSSVFYPSLEHTNIHTVYYTVAHTLYQLCQSRKGKRSKPKQQELDP